MRCIENDANLYQATLPGAVLGKNIGVGLAPHHLGGNNEQNYSVQLSSILSNLCTVITLKIWGDLGKIWGGGVPPWPQPRTATERYRAMLTNNETISTNIDKKLSYRRETARQLCMST